VEGSCDDVVTDLGLNNELFEVRAELLEAVFYSSDKVVAVAVVNVIKTSFGGAVELPQSLQVCQRVS
jgi:hypothetical protein